MPKLKRKKRIKREFWIVESEFGLDFKRYLTNVLKTEAEAKAYLKYISLRNPLDKH
jgi:hypothetical protein